MWTENMIRREADTSAVGHSLSRSHGINWLRKIPLVRKDSSDSSKAIMPHRINSDDHKINTSVKWERASEILPSEDNLKSQSGTHSAVLTIESSSAPSASLEVRSEPSEADGDVSVLSPQSLEIQGSCAQKMTSQLPPAFHGIPPPPQIPRPLSVRPNLPPNITPPACQPSKILPLINENSENLPCLVPHADDASVDSVSASVTTPSTTLPAVHSYAQGQGPTIPKPTSHNSGPALVWSQSPVRNRSSTSSHQHHHSSAPPTTYPQQTPLDSSASPLRASHRAPFSILKPKPRPLYPHRPTHSQTSRNGVHPAGHLMDATVPKILGKKLDAYVAPDPFTATITNQGGEKVPAISNDTTFDDIPTAGSTHPPFQVRLGNSYGPSMSHSHPQRASFQTSASQAHANIASLPRVYCPNPANHHDLPLAGSLRPYHDPYIFSSGSDTKPRQPDWDLILAGYVPVKEESFRSRIGQFIRRHYERLRYKGPLVNQTCSVTVPPNQQIQEETEGCGDIKATNKITFVVLPRMLYLYLLLCLPSLYFGRVARIFEEADLSLPEIKKMALETAAIQGGKCDLFAMEKNALPPQYERLKVTWETFIDDVMREWQTFNIISVLLLSAILSILSHTASATDPVLKYCALSSLICALLSLLFGCTFIIQFGGMRKTYKAAEWALEAKKTKTCIIWNVWVLLAMPVIWLTWSILLFLLCIMLFVWRAGRPLVTLSDGDLLAARLILTFLLVVGITYGILILATFMRYGEKMDKAWKRRIDGWLEEQAAVVREPSTFFPHPSLSNFNPDHRQEGAGLRRTHSLPTMSSTRILEADSGHDQISYQGPPPYLQHPPSESCLQRSPSYPQHPPPSYLSDMEVGYGYTSDREKLDDYHTQRNTMRNRSAHFKSRNTRTYTATNANHDSDEISGSTTPPLTPVVSVESLPSSRIALLNAGIQSPLRNSSTREYDEGNENQDTGPHVRFRLSSSEPSGPRL